MDIQSFNILYYMLFKLCPSLFSIMSFSRYFFDGHMSSIIYQDYKLHADIY